MSYSESSRESTFTSTNLHPLDSTIVILLYYYDWLGNSTVLLWLSFPLRVFCEHRVSGMLPTHDKCWWISRVAVLVHSNTATLWSRVYGVRHFHDFDLNVALHRHVTSINQIWYFLIGTFIYHRERNFDEIPNMEVRWSECNPLRRYSRFFGKLASLFLQKRKLWLSRCRCDSFNPS